MAIQYESDSALALAVRKAGSQTAFARLIGKRQSVVHDWLRAGSPLPAELVLPVEAKLGIPRHQLRPDLYPPEEYSSSPGTQPDGASAEGRRKSSAGAGDIDPLAGLRS